MTRGATAEPSGPPFVKTYRVVSPNRIRIERTQIDGLVPWLKGETVERTAVPGPRGGIILTAPDAILEVIDKLEPGGLLEEAASSRRADYARFLGMRWPVTFTYETKGRYTITLPEGARQFGILPGEDGTVVVFVSGEIFEIWDRNEWLKHLGPQTLTVRGIVEDLE